ncbi:5-oxoprolinase (ATP-hydrolysing) [Sulfurovum sp. NBC37-1]|nr:5-oxoprolinase (ATP-hydrolysing) [Sulfurovum sp. NBC37-1]
MVVLTYGVNASEKGSHLNVESEKSKYEVTDAHLHYVDFLQKSDGIKDLLKMMDRTGVKHAMLNGLAVVKKWNAVDPVQPKYYLADDSRSYWYSATDVIVARALETLSASERRRFHPFICGFNPTDRNAVDHLKRMFALYPDTWEGIGEILTRHDDLTALTYGEQARANHIALDAVYDFAAEHDLPVTIHSDISSVWVHKPLYLEEMEEAVKNHPKTRIVWAHAGASRRIVVPNLASIMGRMLKTYPNLWIDLSWVVYPNYVAPHGKPSKEWVALVEEFPDRFMIGTDNIGHYDNYEQTIKRYYVFLDALSPKTARLVAEKNFLSILPLRVRKKIDASIAK